MPVSMGNASPNTNYPRNTPSPFEYQKALDLDAAAALAGATFFQKRPQIIAIDWLRQMRIESGHSRLVPRTLTSILSLPGRGGREAPGEGLDFSRHRCFKLQIHSRYRLLIAGMTNHIALEFHPMHLDNWLFILLIAMAALFRLLASKASDAAKKKTKPPPESTSAPRTSQPVTRRPVDTDEERIRRFLEALGQPTSSSPQAPVTPRPTYQKPILLPRTPPLASPLPPLKTRPPDLPKEIPSPGQIVSIPRPVTTKIPEPAAFEIHQGAPPVEPPALTSTPAEAYAIAPESPAPSGTDLGDLLGSVSSLRNAIILREIFGPPRGLQPFDFLSAS